MVKVIQKGNTSTPQSSSTESYQCEECGLLYMEKEWGEKCEAWYKEHKSCNLDIIAHACS